MAKDCQKRKRKLVEPEKPMSREDAIRDSTNGGRALNAVWALPKDKIDSAEALILLYLGSKVDFTGSFTAAQSKSVKTIAAATKLSEDTVLRRSNSLVEKGYLKKKPKFHKVTGKQLCCDYSITSKLFDDYADILENKDRSQRVLQSDKPRSQRVSPPQPAGVPPAGSGTLILSSSSSPVSCSPSSEILAGNSPRHDLEDKDTSPVKIGMDILYSEMRLRFHDMTPGEHTRAIVIRMLQKLGGRKGDAQKNRRRVLSCIESVKPRNWIYNEKSKEFWLRHLDEFDQNTDETPPLVQYSDEEEAAYRANIAAAEGVHPFHVGVH